MITSPLSPADQVSSTLLKVARNTRYEDLPELLTAREAATLLNISPWTVYQSIERNVIPSVKVGRKKLYVPRSYFLELVKGR